MFFHNFMLIIKLNLCLNFNFNYKEINFARSLTEIKKFIIMMFLVVYEFCVRNYSTFID